MDKTLQTCIVKLRAEEQKLLLVLGELPSAEPFEHGVQVGKYRGICAALEIIEAVLRDTEE
jgi:hypothetical protein